MITQRNGHTPTWLHLQGRDADIHSFEVSHVPRCVMTYMFTKCFLGLEDGLDWSVSLANFVKEDKCLWGDNLEYRELEKLMEATQNYACFMSIFKGSVYSDVFEELIMEYKA